MFLTRWLREIGRKQNPKAAPVPQQSFRPGLEALGDRIAPHAGGFGGSFAAPWSLIGFGAADAASTADASVATEFAVLSRSEAYGGSEAQIAVVALNADGRPVRDYTGTVTLTSTDPAAKLPESYTFTTADHGRHTFTVTLNTLGTQTITATDGDKVTGTADVTVVTAPVATELFVQSERTVYAGGVTRVVVAALDDSNHVDRAYTGTVTLTSTDAGATLPAAYTFTAKDRGVHVFEFTPSATGDQTVTATDGAALTGKVTVSVDAAPVATKLAVISRPVSESGQTVQFFVVALDANNRPVPTYTGTVAFTSTDTAAKLPESYTFTAADRGVKALTATLATAGEQTISVTDSTDGTLTGTTTVQVAKAGSLAGFGFGFGFPRPHRGFR